MKKTALFSQTSPLSIFKKGFTLIELVIVISIIAILSTVALFGFSKAQAAGRDASRASTFNSIRAALERYYADNQQYPAGTNGFCGLKTALIPTYIPAASWPTDPQTKADPCSAATGQAAAGGAWYVYYATVSGSVYPSYILKLGKESVGEVEYRSPL